MAARYKMGILMKGSGKRTWRMGKGK